MERNHITLLSSGVTLGIYVPALTINYQLKKKGIETDVVILESLFYKDKQNKLPETKSAFHKNFKFALMGQKVTGNIFESIDELTLNKVLEIWRKEKRDHFLVFSGFWIPVIEKYLSFIDFEIKVIVCHMDACESISWKKTDTNQSRYQHIWMFSWEDKAVHSFLNINQENPLDFENRSKRLIIHGGGWGIGTYKNVIPKLSELNYGLDIIAYEKSDLTNSSDQNRYFMINPEWKSWEKDMEGFYTFPPLGEVKTTDFVEFKNNRQHSEVYHLIAKSRAIISKPGGATLIDSLSSATPLIYLEPFGEYENTNSKLWEFLGFGISYAKWEESGFSNTLLENLHTNLMKTRQNLKNYLEDLYAA